MNLLQYYLWTREPGMRELQEARFRRLSKPLRIFAAIANIFCALLYFGLLVYAVWGLSGK